MFNETQRKYFLITMISILSMQSTYGSSDPLLIEEVLVSATREDKTIESIPMAISVIRSEDINRGRQQIGLDEALNQVPGVFSQNRYNFAQDLRIAIRGFGSRANFGIRGIKVFSDGIPATLADGQSGVDDIDLNSIDRIEVLRGPASSLFGASSGGVLNLISAEGPKIPFVETGIIVGDYGQEKYHFKAGGQSENLNYAISASRLNYDGYRKHSETKNTLFNSKVRYQLNNDSSITMILNLVDSPIANDPGAIKLSQVDEDRRQAQPRNTASNAGEKLDQQKVSLTYEHSFNSNSNITVRNYYLWRDFSAFLPIGTHIPFVSDDGVVEFDRFFWGGGVQWNRGSTIGDLPYRFIIGLDLDIQRDDRQRYLNESGQKGMLSFDQLEQAESYGLFMQNELDLSDSLTFSMGLRYDHVKLTVEDQYLENADQSSILKFNKLSPNIALLWAVNSESSIYFNYGTSFETPTFTELANPARNLNSALGGFNNVQAQDTKSFEIGFRGDLFDQKLYIDMAAFLMDVKDEITSVENIGNRTFFQNADTNRKGLEFFSQLTFGERLTASFSYTFSDFTFDKFDNNVEIHGNSLPGIPKHYLFAELEFTPIAEAFIIADLIYSSKLQTDNGNTLSAEPSIVVNLRTGYSYTLGHWTLEPFFGINNILNEKYFSNIRINGFGGRLFEPGPGRNIYGGLTIQLSL